MHLDISLQHNYSSARKCFSFFFLELVAQQNNIGGGQVIKGIPMMRPATNAISLAT